MISNNYTNNKHRLIGAILCLTTAQAIQWDTDVEIMRMEERLAQGNGLAQVNARAENVGEDILKGLNDAVDGLEDAVNYIGGGSLESDLSKGIETMGEGLVDAVNYIGGKGGFESDISNIATDVYNWADGAVNDADKWLGQAAVDTDKWLTTAADDVNDWVEVAAADIQDWSVGALSDIGEWSSGAVIDVRHWSIDAAQDFSELATDVFDRMGELGDQVLDEIDDIYDSVQDWSKGAIATLESKAEIVVDNFLKLDDHFKVLGQVAVELYKQAESAVDEKKAELEALADAVLADSIKLGAYIKSQFNKLNDLALKQIGVLNASLKIAAAKLEELGDDVLSTEAGQKTKAFILGAIEEVSKAGEHVYKSTDKIIQKIEQDGLHNILADAIDHVGNVAAHTTTEVLLEEIGGAVAKVATIPVTTAMNLVGLEEQGNAIRSWLDGALQDMSDSLEQSMKDQTKLFSTLLRDPKKFVEMIQLNPSLIDRFIQSVAEDISGATLTWGEDQIKNFSKTYGSLTALPKQWF